MTSTEKITNTAEDSVSAGRSAVRLNQIQVIGTHNSYHREISLSERAIFEKYVPSPEDYYYSHSDLSNQLQHQQVRSLELDLHSDENGGLYYPPLIWTLSNLSDPDTTPFNGAVLKQPGIKIFHVTDFDTDAVCHTFTACLQNLKQWSDRNRNHVPILIDLELKTDAEACIIGGVCPGEATNWTLPRLLNVDAEIRSVLPSSQLLTPDDVRTPSLTLEQSVLKHGWPLLDDVRGRFMFYFDNNPEENGTDDPRTLYTANGHASLQNRVVFTNSLEGSPDCAFIKHNSPDTAADLAEIQRLVKKGYIVRTRADTPIGTVLARNTTMRDMGLKSGAQVVSTDFPAWGMSARWGWDYAVSFGGGKVARCNPVSAPRGCRDADLE